MNLKSGLKKFTPTRTLVIVMLLLLILLPLNVYWNMDRINKFQAWRTEYQEAQTFTFYDMWTASLLVNSTSFRTNSTAQAWYMHELSSAYLDMSHIGTFDTAHWNQLLRMEMVFYSLSTDTAYAPGLTDSQRTTLSKILYSIGDDILNAYTKYGDFVNPGTWTLLWYSGPTPPDDYLVNQAYNLATTLPGLPALPT